MSSRQETWLEIRRRAGKAEAERDIEREKLAAAIRELDQARERLGGVREALEPFVEYAKNNVDEHGWKEGAGGRDRIVDWFGPSDFRALATFTAQSSTECERCHGDGEVEVEEMRGAQFVGVAKPCPHCESSTDQGGEEDPERFTVGVDRAEAEALIGRPGPQSVAFRARERVRSAIGEPSMFDMPGLARDFLDADQPDPPTPSETPPEQSPKEER